MNFIVSGPCLKASLSTVLGLGIVAGSVMGKLFCHFENAFLLFCSFSGYDSKLLY
jgi:hypothetical protein